MTVILCILDGWGIGDEVPCNAIYAAKTPNFDKVMVNFPHAKLGASESAVGLPTGQMGTSEVGHINIGAGRVVFQSLPMIDNAIKTGELASNTALLAVLSELKAKNKTLHIMGLLSDGGVHSHISHIIELIKIAASHNVAVSIHAFLDGRDCPPQSGLAFVQTLQKEIANINNVHIASLCGRFYAMDRDNRWDRIQSAYNLIANAEAYIMCGDEQSLDKTIQYLYDVKMYDEFLKPVVVEGYKGIQDGDAVLFANFRSDRARELSSAFCLPEFEGFVRTRIPKISHFIGMTEYSDVLSGHMSALFPAKNIDNGIGELLSKLGKRQLRLAETEKYAHVTFFFNGGREEPFDLEDRILVPSPKVQSYDTVPEMSAHQVTDELIAAIKGNKYDFIVVNYANPDMVGHTGNLKAAIKAVETVDECLGR
ncbi:MAG: 2,3-bisphosphoglycerate-independent phosphoglycerate mutase, partial [Alphaproteobacteria bacterium]|nr:2,3-bisphosphoglycerate-independent phosphoglycerate mutase [Alphaproteobacteria bacterium]